MGTPGRQPATWSLGTTVGGKYRLEALLGAGGFGAVFRAVEPGSQSRVAIKLLSRAAMAHTDSLARFYREARLAMTLRHPNTVRLLDFGDAGDGTPFIAFELLEGMSLEQRLASGALPLPEALSITCELLASLEEAHASQVVHRDVKPANVFLCRHPAGAIKLLDFGVAQEAPSGSLERLTREGTLVGTPGYMAPEQLAGRPSGPQTDLFAVALVLAEMLSGLPVYRGDAMGICIMKLNGQPAPLPASIPPALMRVLQRATAFEPAHRYRSAAEMRAALLAAGPEAARPSHTPPPVSGLAGTFVMDKPAISSGSINRAMAATAPPSINTPLAAHPAPSRGMKGTLPLDGPVSRPRPSALASTTPPSIANPLGATNLDRPRRAVSPILAATVNDPDATSPLSGPLSGTLAMTSAPGASVRIAPAPAASPRPRSRAWPVAIVVLSIVLAAAAFAAYRLGGGRLIP